MPRLPMLVLAAVLAVAAACPAAARSLESLGVSEAATLPAVRPDWPVPAEPNQLFYVQRSTNANTVVYVARFGADGRLDRRAPVAAYWRRYDTDGARRALGFFEEAFAYGVRARPVRGSADFTVTPRALSRAGLLLRQTGPGRAELLARIGGRWVRAVYAFVHVDETGLIPRVTGLSVHGIDPATGRAVTETFRVSGGEILQ